jgi:hypothetical protein
MMEDEWGLSEEDMDFLGKVETDDSKEAQYFEQKEEEEDSIIGDSLQGIGHGLVDAADETLQFGGAIADTVVEGAGDIIGTVGKMTGIESLEQASEWDLYDQSDNDRFLPEIFDKPSTAAGKLLEEIAQFGGGLIGAGKFRMAMRGRAAAKGGMKSRETLKALDHRTGSWGKKAMLGSVDSAAASLIVQDPYEDTLAEIISENDWIGYELTDWLANQDDDTAWTRRFKNLGEDVLLSGIVLHGAKAWRAFKGRGDSAVESTRIKEDNALAKMQIVQESRGALREHVKQLRDSGTPAANADAIKAQAYISTRVRSLELKNYLKGMVEGGEKQEFLTLLKSVKTRSVKGLSDEYEAIFGDKGLVAGSIKRNGKISKVAQKKVDGFFKKVANELETPHQRKDLGLDEIEEHVLIVEGRVKEAYDIRMGRQRKEAAERAVAKSRDDAIDGADPSLGGRKKTAREVAEMDAKIAAKYGLTDDDLVRMRKQAKEEMTEC